MAALFLTSTITGRVCPCSVKFPCTLQESAPAGSARVDRNRISGSALHQGPLDLALFSGSRYDPSRRLLDRARATITLRAIPPCGRQYSPCRCRSERQSRDRAPRLKRDRPCTPGQLSRMSGHQSRAPRHSLDRPTQDSRPTAAARFFRDISLANFGTSPPTSRQRLLCSPSDFASSFQIPGGGYMNGHLCHS